jgi:putative transposase
MNRGSNTESEDKPGRKSIRLPGFDYSGSGGYFVTIVTFGRDFLFGEIADGRMRVNALGEIVQECWEAIPVHFPNTTIDAFCIMPNHIHGIIFIHENPGRGTIYRAPTSIKIPTINQREEFGQPTTGSLPTIIRTIKAAVTRRAGRVLNSGNLWQRNYYEHILRNQADYGRIAGYFRDNPANWIQDDENPLIHSHIGDK